MVYTEVFEGGQAVEDNHAWYAQDSEHYEGVAEDRAEVFSLDERAEVPGSSREELVAFSQDGA